MPSGPETENLVRFLLERRLINETQLKEARYVLEKISRLGVRMELEEVFVRKGMLNPEQLAFVHAATGKGRSDLLPGYEIIKKLGQGSMGAVYKAKQLAMDRLVAIKVLLPHFANEKNAVDRFLRESKVLAKLSHPNVINGIDAGYQKGIYYFVMEYFEGRSVEELIGSGKRYQPVEAIPVIRQVASALDHARGLGVVHRDVKPGNIMVDPSGKTKLADLGLAKLQSGQVDIQLTQVGYVLGTPAYMSPEQVRGDIELDTRSDIYSLGVTLFEMLSGEKASRGATAAAMFRHKLEEDVPINKLRGRGVPEPVLRVIRKMCVRNREHRYTTPADLVADLKQLEEGVTPTVASVPIPSRRMTRVTRVMKPKRNPWVIPGIAAAILLVGLVAYLLIPRKPPPYRSPRIVSHEPPPKPETPRPASEKPEPPAPKEPDPARPAAPDLSPLWRAALEYEDSFSETKPEEVLLNYIRLKERLRGTPQVVDCEKKIEAWVVWFEGQVYESRSKLQAGVDADLSAETFGPARERISKARAMYSNASLTGRSGLTGYSGWKRFVKEQSLKVEGGLAATLEKIRMKADELARQERFDEARETWLRLKSFGIVDYAREADSRVGELDSRETALKDRLEKARVGEKPRIEKRWRAAVDLARKRSYLKAVQTLDALTAELKHPDHIRAIRRLAEDMRVIGTFVEGAEPDAPASKVIKSAHDSEPRCRFLFCVLEEDLKGAEQELRKAGKLPSEYAQLLDELRGRAEAQKLRAKKATDRLRKTMADYRKTSSRAKAVEDLKALKKEYGDVLTRSQTSQIDRALESHAAKVERMEIVIHASEVTRLNSRWTLIDVKNPTALGRVLTTPERGMDRKRFMEINREWFEIVVEVKAGIPYTLWVHMSTYDDGANSIFLQVEDAQEPDGGAFFPIGGEEAFRMEHQRDGHSTRFGWVNGYEDPEVEEPATFRFRTEGRKRLRFYKRDDGTMIDQIMLSAGRFLNQRPDQDTFQAQR